MTSKFNYYWLFSYIVILTLVFSLQPKPESDLKLSQPTYDLNKLSQNTGDLQNPLFKDLTLQAGLTIPHSQKSGDIHGLHESLGAGICTFDFDNDGWLDILQLTGSGNTHYFGHQEWWQNEKNSVQLYRNNKDGTFSNVTRDANLKTSAITIGCAVGDFDDDGNLDLFLANRGKNELWKNLSNGKFEQKGAPFDLQDSWSTSAVVADFNGDNRKDIYLTNYIKFKPNSLTFEKASGFRPEKHPNFDATLYSGAPNRLLINQGNWKFSDQTDDFEVANSQGRSLSATTTDLNQDGVLDILIANDSNSENKAFINQGKRFSDESTQLGLATLDSTTSISLSEDNQEIFVLQSSGSGNYNRVFKLTNDNSGSVNEVTDRFKFRRYSNTYETSWPPAVADFNSDGFNDLLFPNGLLTPNQDAKSLTQNQHNTLLLSNASKLALAPIIDKKVVIPAASSRCASAGDFNNDGAIDAIIASNNGPPQLLINQSSSPRWVGFIVDNSINNIEIKAEKREIKRTVKNGTNGFCWQDNRRIVIPLESGKGSGIELTLKLNSNANSLTSKLSINRYYRVSEAGLSEVEEPQKEQSSISLSSFEGRALVTHFLLSDNQKDLAFKEARLLINGSAMEMIADSSKLRSLLTKFTLGQKLRLAPDLLSSKNSELQLIGIELAQQTESDLLIRWLLPLINSKDSRVSCATSKAFEHFFKEEEAMTLSKYASLTSLIRKSEEDSSSSLCAIKALGESERYRAVEPLVKLISSSRNDIQYEAISALGRIREKNALTQLKKVLWNKQTPIKNKAASLDAIQQIDSDFNLLDELQNGVIKPREAILGLLVAAISPYSSTRESKKQQYKSWIVENYEKGISNLSDDELANYALITQQPSVVSLLKSRASQRSLSSTAPLKALLELDSANNNNYLLKLIEIDPTYVPDQNINLKLNLNLKAIVSVLDVSKDKLNALKRYPRHIEENDLKKLVERALEDKLTAIEQSILSTILEDYSLGELIAKKVCLFALQTLPTKEANAFLQDFFTKHPSSIEVCVRSRDKTLKNSELLELSKKYPRLAPIVATLLSEKKDRKSREFVLKVILDPSEDTNVRKALVRSLPSPITSTKKQALEDIFDDTKDPNLLLVTMEKLASTRSWVADNQKSIEQHLKTSIETKHDFLTIGLSKILFKHEPKSALDILVNPS